MPIRSLGYIDWSTPAAKEWETFAADFIGFMPSTGPEDVSYYRWDDRPYRLIVREAPQPGLRAIGFEVGNDEELAEAVTRLESAGVGVALGTAEETAARAVTGLARFADPDGIGVELFYGPVLTHERVVTPLVSHFVTGDLGLGHVVLSVADTETTGAFYRQVLGLKMRNTMRFPRPDGGAYKMQFLGCNERHHTLGYMDYPVPGNLMHFMVEAATLDDVGYALDRCIDGGWAIAQNLGRHTNDHMVSFYVVGPDGAQIEVGWGGLKVDEETSTTYEITKTSFWGHRPLKPQGNPDD